MTVPSDDDWATLTDEQQQRRLVAARAVLREACRLVGPVRVANLLIAGWRSTLEHSETPTVSAGSNRTPTTDVAGVG